MWSVSALFKAVAGFTLAGVPTASTDVKAFATDLTSMVIPITVGTPPQQVFVAVNFERKKSWLFSSGECPPFIECYKSSSSITFVFNGHRAKEYFNGATLDGFSCSDDFSLGESVWANTEFSHINHHQGLSTKGRDVAGELALGPTSDLVSERTIEIRADIEPATRYSHGSQRWKLVFDPEIPQPTHQQLDVSFNIDRRKNSWKFTSSVYISGKEVYRRVHAKFIPNEDDVIVPKSDSSFFLRHLVPEGTKHLVSPSGRLYLECSPSSGPAKTHALKQISLRTLDGSRYINILPHTLQYSGLLNTQSVISNEEGRFCPTRISIVTGNNQWTFGLPLLASVERAYMDARNLCLIFRIIAGSSQRTEFVIRDRPETPQSLGFRPVPRFHSPEIQISGSGARAQTSIKFTSNWSRVGRGAVTDLILHSVNAQGNEDSSEFRFQFLRSRHSLLPSLENEGNTSEELPGLLQAATLSAKIFSSDTEGTLVSFDFSAATNPDNSSYIVTINDEEEKLVVVLRKTDGLIDLEHFDIPPQTTVSEDEQLEDCGICKATIDAGTNEQALPCGDRFHPDCIQRWISKIRSCPNCRGLVELRTTVKPYLLRRAT